MPLTYPGGGTESAQREADSEFVSADEAEEIDEMQGSLGSSAGEMLDNSRPGWLP